MKKYMNDKINSYSKYETENKKKLKHLEQIIREEIQNEFGNDKNIYIYDKILVKYNIIEIFVILLNNSSYNRRQIDITFLIIIREDYPKNSPLVFCLTEFNKNMDIFDVRNIQKNLILNWTSYCKLSDLIKNIPILIENLDSQVTNKLQPDIGEYYINSLHYDLNDFLLNINNKFFRVKINIISNNNEDVFDMYLIITKSNLIFLKPCYEEKKNICKIRYIINLIEIIGLKNYPNSNEELKGLVSFQIILDEKSSNKKINDLIIFVEEKNLIINQINSLIKERKEKILKKFKYFEKSEMNTISDIEKIIEIKKKKKKKKKDENIFNQIHELYNKLIEISSNKEGGDFSKYIKDFQEFLGSYDDKIKKMDKKEIPKQKEIFRFKLE